MTGTSWMIIDPSPCLPHIITLAPGMSMSFSAFPRKYLAADIGGNFWCMAGQWCATAHTQPPPLSSNEPTASIIIEVRQGQSSNSRVRWDRNKATSTEWSGGAGESHVTRASSECSWIVAAYHGVWIRHAKVIPSMMGAGRAHTPAKRSGGVTPASNIVGDFVESNATCHRPLWWRLTFKLPASARQLIYTSFLPLPTCVQHFQDAARRFWSFATPNRIARSVISRKTMHNEAVHDASVRCCAGRDYDNRPLASRWSARNAIRQAPATA